MLPVGYEEVSASSFGMLFNMIWAFTETFEVISGKFQAFQNSAIGNLFQRDYCIL
jgi:hypothetical protein